VEAGWACDGTHAYTLWFGLMTACIPPCTLRKVEAAARDVITGYEVLTWQQILFWTGGVKAQTGDAPAGVVIPLHRLFGLCS
jgi:hypothetical protein